jgi:hypothetical protein
MYGIAAKPYELSDKIFGSDPVGLARGTGFCFSSWTFRIILGFDVFVLLISFYRPEASMGPGCLTKLRRPTRQAVVLRA